MSVVSAPQQAIRSFRQRLGPWDRFTGRSQALSAAVYVVVLVGGLALRLLALRTSVAGQNADSAVVYVMARHAAHGDWRVFLVKGL